MRTLVVLTIALFVGILATTWILSARAHPQMIDVDPAAVHPSHHR
jgi:hypothetical protein